MAEIFTFFEEGLKSYIDQSFSKYAKNPEIIFDKNFENIILNPLFINDISLFKNLIQKNKLKSEIWKSIGDFLYVKMNGIINEFNDSIKLYQTKISQYKERIKRSNSYIEYINKRANRRKEQIKNNYNEDIKKKNVDEENEKGKDDEDNLSDVKCEEYNSKSNAELIQKLLKYEKLVEKENNSIEVNEQKIRHKKKKIIIGNVNLLKLNILNLTVNILINEINSNELNETDENKESNYLSLNKFINDLIDKCEEIKEKMNISYTNFIKSFVIELVLTINNRGYKDINKYYLNKLLDSIKDNQTKYSSQEISDLIAYIEKIIKNPDSFLCPNAFSILKNASLNKIRPRSRNNSFDKNDLTVNNNNNNNINNNNGNNNNNNNNKNDEVKNNNNKNEKNSKIDDYFKRKKSESEDEEDCIKKFSSIISFKNSNQNNSNNLLNYNFHSQLSFGRIENSTSMLKYNSMSSALSNNNSLLGPGGANFQYQTSNVLNNSRLSGDDSMSAHGHNIYKTSFSELLPHDYISNHSGINSRLYTQLPFLRNTKKEIKKKNPVENFKEKLEKECSGYKRNNVIKESSDKIIKREISSIVDSKFYSNEIFNDAKNKNTTASDNKPSTDDNKILNFNEKKKINIDEVLVSKTPMKINFKTEESKDDKFNENIQNNGIRKNLGALFNQQIDK